MNLHGRLSAVQRERGRRCSACGGPIVVALPPRPKTWQSVMKDFSDLSDEQLIAFHAHYKSMDKLPARHQELAYKMYCQQQGIPNDLRSMPYSSPNPPPAPWLADA